MSSVSREKSKLNMLENRVLRKIFGRKLGGGGGMTFWITLGNNLYSKNIC